MRTGKIIKYGICVCTVIIQCERGYAWGERERGRARERERDEECHR